MESTGDESLVVTAQDINKALGSELRRARDLRGWTRRDLIARITSDFAEQSLANYEYGIRPMTLARLAELCIALGIPTSGLVTLALQRAGFEPCWVDLIVDLRQLARHGDDVGGGLQRWALERLSREANVAVYKLSRSAVEEMAVLLCVGSDALTADLRKFTPDRVPERMP